MTIERVSMDGCRSVWPIEPEQSPLLVCLLSIEFRTFSIAGKMATATPRPSFAGLAPRFRVNRPRHTQCTARASTSASADGGMVTRDEIATAAKKRGLAVETSTSGPFFKITARRLSTRAGEEGQPGTEETDIIGEHDGFIAPPPFGILHMDSMRIYNSRVRGDDEKAKMRSTFGLSILLGATSSLMAHEAGCRKVELLSIDDGNEYAPKLVKYYRRLGFKVVKEVGDNGFFEDLPHLLVWGGVGTRMDGNLQQLLSKWGGIVRKQAAAQ